jgi:hypothetical protein
MKISFRGSLHISPMLEFEALTKSLIYNVLRDRSLFMEGGEEKWGGRKNKGGPYVEIND